MAGCDEMNREQVAVMIQHHSVRFSMSDTFQEEEQTGDPHGMDLVVDGILYEIPSAG